MEAFEIRAYRAGDAERLQAIRRIAFHEGIREQLGDEIYDRVRGDDDHKQAEYLDILIAGGERKELYVLLHNSSIAGFIGLTIDEDGIGGEIDLNAVDPAFQGQGGGSLMYDFALRRLKALGVTLARVGTGLDGNSCGRTKGL